MICYFIGNWRVLVAEEGAVLRLPLFCQWLNKLAHQSRQIALGIGRVLSADDMVGDEGEVVALPGNG